MMIFTEFVKKIDSWNFDWVYDSYLRKTRNSYDLTYDEVLIDVSFEEGLKDNSFDEIHWICQENWQSKFWLGVW